MQTDFENIILEYQNKIQHLKPRADASIIEMIKMIYDRADFFNLFYLYMEVDAIKNEYLFYKTKRQHNID